MKCPFCSLEGHDIISKSPCPSCGRTWKDTYHYVEHLAQDLHVDAVLDIGCGLKGIIAQAYWESLPISRGYACDIHVIKPLPSVWTPLLQDACSLVDRLGPQGVDFTTHCGALEHFGYRAALDLLHVVERVTRLRFFATCSTVLREVDYKVKRDGNPNHYYKSWWCPDVFEALGYTVDRKSMADRTTFTCEVPFWADPIDLADSWESRCEAAVQVLVSRRCFQPSCAALPLGWAPEDGEGNPSLTGVCFCFDHRPISVRENLQDPRLADVPTPQKDLL